MYAPRYVQLLGEEKPFSKNKERLKDLRTKDSEQKKDHNKRKKEGKKNKERKTKKNDEKGYPPHHFVEK